MPRKKKNGQSPARGPGPSNDNTNHYRISGTSIDGAPISRSDFNDAASNFPYGGRGDMLAPPNSGGSSDTYKQEEIVRNMQEMFSHLDPEVIYIVLSECDFKVENAMDSLLELSVAAEGVDNLPPLSGFEMAAALLSPQHHPIKPEPQPHRPIGLPVAPLSLSPQPASLQSHDDQDLSSGLTEEFDLLIDRELETLTTQSPHQNTLPELLLSSPGASTSWSVPLGDQSCPGKVLSAGQPSGLHSPWSDRRVSTSGGAVGCQQQDSLLDFSHLTSGPDKTGPTKPSLVLGAPGHPSAFQVYRNPAPPPGPPGEKWAVSLDSGIRGAREKTRIAGGGQEELLCNTQLWNTEAPEFQPRILGNDTAGGPVFITPVVKNPSPWHTQAMPASQWWGHGPFSKATVKVGASAPRSWTEGVASALRTPVFPGARGRLRLEGRVLVILRGAPGSGKTTLARAMLEQNPHGVVLSTDDYFCRRGEYCYDPSVLGEAHEWNHSRAKEAMEASSSPVIIDNTNMQGWEMRPYIATALRLNYKVLFREPDTWWKNKPRELERRSKHGVSAEKIRRMIDRYERHVTIQSIMGSACPKPDPKLRSQLDPQPPTQSPAQLDPRPPPQSLAQLDPQPPPQSPAQLDPQSPAQLDPQPPPQSLAQLDPERPFQPDNRQKRFFFSLSHSLSPDRHKSSDGACPDLVAEQLLVQGFMRPPPKLFSSLPDVSSVGCFGRDPGVTHGSTESLPSLRERPSDNEDSLDLAVLHPELKAQEELWEGEEEEGEERRGEEREEGSEWEEGGTGTTCCPVESVLFNTSCHGDDEIPVAFSESIGQRVRRERRSRTRKTDSLEPADIVKDTSHLEREGGGMGDGGERGRPELLDFVGDWPLGEALGQRGLGRRKGRPVVIEGEGGCDSEEAGHRGGGPGGGADFTEFQKLLDLLQTGVDSSPIHSSLSPSPASDPSPCDEGERREAAGRRGEADGLTSSERDRDQVESRELPCNVVVESNPGTDQSQGENLQCAGEGGHEGSVQEEDGVEVGVSSEAGKGVAAADDGSDVTEVTRCTEVSEVGVDGKVSHLYSLGGGSQERRQPGRSRRAGKHCKLALTFTHNTPPPPKPSVGPHRDLGVSPDPKPDPRCPSPPPSWVDPGRSTQTDPQDFAFLWRLENDGHSYPDYAKNTTPPTVLHGDPSHFIPGVSDVVSAGFAVQSSGQRVVPYRVGHDKGSQVEESELEGGRTRQENLNILQRHFKQVNWETLEDLYNKCQQDLEWTSNLLLDSGERLFREEEEGGEEDDDLLGLFGNMDMARRAVPGCLGGPEGVCSDSEKEVVPSGGQELKVQASPISRSDAEGGVALGSSEEEVGVVEVGPVRDSGLNHSVSEGGGGKGQEEENTALGESTHLESRSTGSDVREPPVAVCMEGGASSEQLLENEEQEPAFMDELNQSLPEILNEMLRREKEERREEERREEERRERAKRKSKHLDIQSVELKLPTELALQLTELFGPVGVDPGACSPDDFAVKMDLNMAKLLHQKWKNTVQERQRQAMLSYHLLQESSVHWGESQTAKAGLGDGSHPTHFLIGADGFASLSSQFEAQDEGPIMDHWSVSRPHISLRDIMTEEQALQENVKRGRSGCERRDGAAMLKEAQLYDLFPSIDRHFLLDMFRDHNYSLEQTEQFLRSVLAEGPVRNVVAPGPTPRSHSRDRDKRRVPSVAPPLPQYQDVEDPEYEDFRAEARLQRTKQQDSFSKAAEAYRQGRKDVASFYAEQGHLHGQKMREANHRAAAQIFERVNSSLLPQNVLDLHGLHVDEALLHLEEVLEKKSTECQQGLCCLQLSVITGRGNHSQGGVARIRPAVIDYLSTHCYRFTEPKPGLVLVSLN
ncbi:NEDD4-binding protein 2 [Esox lucius]|uniref:NEDD4-binding protein 2 n=1 Tax=Esox lucius TaxID=8010 RepID=UPI0014777780|nr:NEDD4-binding protein 2 [Esox lucius]